MKDRGQIQLQRSYSQRERDSALSRRIDRSEGSEAVLLVHVGVVLSPWIPRDSGAYWREESGVEYEGDFVAGVRHYLPAY